MANRARVVGIHLIAAKESVHLVELEIEGSTDRFDIGEIAQEVLGQPRSHWQAVYDERQIGQNRFVLFFQHLDTAKPLLSPAGPLFLPPESSVPEHLQGIEDEQP